VPIFFEDELVGFAGASAHLLDIGGAFPGPRRRPRRQLVGGQHLPRGQALERGVRQDELWQHILENTRTPTYNRGDIEAMIAACELAKTRYLELLARYGQASRSSAPRATGSTTRSGCSGRRSRRCRTASTRPTSGWLDDDGRNRGVPLPVKVKVVVEEDELTIDLTGLERRGADRLQLPVRGHDRLGDDVHRPDDLPRRGAYPVFVPQNEGMLKPVKGRRAEGLDLQPELPARRASPASARCSAQSTSC
jgi:5-oxoprolinase (ATP-hydrolysing)